MTELELAAAIGVIAAIVSMLSALGIFGYVRQYMGMVAEHHRTLYGEPSVEEWVGIVPTVHDNRTRIEELEDITADDLRPDGGLELPDAGHESGTARDGFLSYAGEWHALILGLGAGLAAGWSSAWEPAVFTIGAALGAKAIPKGPLREIKREPWYAIGGVFVGLALGLALRAF